MPSRPITVMILLLWLGATAWLVQRDILPALGIGDITYEQTLASRAVETPVEWTIYRGDVEVGTVFFVLKPKPDSSYLLESQARVALPIAGMDNTNFELKSAIHVNPLKRLESFDVQLSLLGARTDARIEGQVVGSRTLRIRGQLLIGDREVMAREVELAVNPNLMVLDLFGQIDQIPGLRPGKTWRTRFVNPLQAMIGGALSLNESTDFIQHTVVSKEPLEWNEESVACYKVEHRYRQVATHSWVRMSDGKVLVQEVQFGGTKFRLVAKPPVAQAVGEDL